MEKVPCFVCGMPVEIADEDPNAVRPLWFKGTVSCRLCQKTYPPALLKSVRDPFRYALKTRDGDVVEFSRAKVNGPWVSLFSDEEYLNVNNVECPRGVDINISEIVWVADAANR